MQGVRDQVGRWKGEGVHPGEACGVVGEVFGREAVYVTDGGMSSLWAGLMLPSCSRVTKSNTTNGTCGIRGPAWPPHGFSVPSSVV